MKIFKKVYNCTWNTFWGNIFENLLRKKIMRAALHMYSVGFVIDMWWTE